MVYLKYKFKQVVLPPVFISNYFRFTPLTADASKGLSGQ